MATLITLLRGVNVGGNKSVPMAQLKDWLGRQGMTDVRTLLNSGNALFRCSRPGGSKLERTLEAAAEHEFKLQADFYVRTLAEWQQLVADNPFAAEARSDPAHLLALVLKAAPTPAQAKALQAVIPGRERAVVQGRHAYLYYPDGVGSSRLTPAVLDRALGTRGTARNWNTVLKLAAVAAELAA